MNIPYSAIEPFGTPRILDKLMETFLINALVRLVEELNSRSPDERRRSLADMHPDVRALISGIHWED